MIAILRSALFAAACLGGDDQPKVERTFTEEQLQARARYATGLELFKKGKHEEAAGIFAGCIRVDPRFQGATRMLGACQIHLEQLDEAASTLLKALNLSPDDGELMKLLASVHRQRKDFGLAHGFLDEAEKRLGRRPDVLRARVELAVDEEDWRAGIAALRGLQAANPEDLQASQQLIELYRRVGELHLAIREARLLAARSKDSQAPVRVVHLLLEAGDHEGAAGELEKLARRRRTDRQIRQMLVRLYSGPVPDRSRLAVHQEVLKRLKNGGR